MFASEERGFPAHLQRTTIKINENRIFKNFRKEIFLMARIIFLNIEADIFKGIFPPHE